MLIDALQSNPEVSLIIHLQPRPGAETDSAPDFASPASRAGRSKSMPEVREVHMACIGHCGPAIVGGVPQRRQRRTDGIRVAALNRLQERSNVVGELAAAVAMIVVVTRARATSGARTVATARTTTIGLCAVPLS